MISEIEYKEPKTIDELLNYLFEYRQDSKIIAGGTDIIPGIQQCLPRFSKIKNLIDINKLAELKEIYIKDNRLIIGAACTYDEIMKNELVKKYAPILAESSSLVGNPQIRNRGTIVGNIVNCAPCADSIPGLLVYDATLTILSKNHKREEKLEDLLINPYVAKINNSELVTNINIPLITGDYKWKYYKLGRRQAVNISRLTYAIIFKIHKKLIKDLRIACGAITPVSKRLYDVEEKFNGKELNDDILREISIEAGKSILKITDYRWSSDYKIPVAQQVLYQVLKSMM